MKTLCSIFVITILIFTFTSCVSDIDENIELFNNSISCVVEIQVMDSDDTPIANATGTMISNDGLILTNRHVVRKYDYAINEYEYFSNFYIRFYNEDEYTKADLIKYSNDSDLALLQIQSESKNYLKFGDSNKLKAAEKIHTIGNGNGFGLAYANGNIAAPLRIVKYENEMIDAIQLALIINEGNSGGPLINNSGELVGITTFRLRDNQNNIIYGTSFALPTKTIKAFLES
jgi:S1-C subfamily serine protease